MRDLWGPAAGKKVPFAPFLLEVFSGVGILDEDSNAHKKLCGEINVVGS